LIMQSQAPVATSRALANSRERKVLTLTTPKCYC
jgi:hypothetical protein